MKKFRSLVIVGLVASMLLSACSDASDDNASSGGGDSAAGVITIGMVEDSTGPGASYAVPAGNTVRDLVERINDEGGVLGKKLDLIVESDNSDSTQTATVARRLVDKGADVLLMITTNAGTAQAKPVFTETETVTIAPVALLPDIAEGPDSDFSYILANSTDDQAQVLIGAFKELGVKKLGIFNDSVPGMIAMTDGFIPHFEEAGIEIVAREQGDTDAADVSAQVARIKNANPDAVFVSSIGGQIEMMFHNTAATEMPDVPRFSLASIGNQPDAWKLAKGDALANLRYISSVTLTNPHTADVNDWLKSVRGDDFVISAYDVQAYDAVRLLVKAIEDAGGVEDRVKIRDSFNAISGFESSFGQKGFTLSFAPDDHIGADGLCGILLGTFTKDNVPGDPWDVYQPSC